MNFFDKLVSTIAPHSCLGCGREGTLLCDWCTPDAFPDLPSSCYRCNRQTKDFLVCPHCRYTSPLKHVWVSTNYDNLAKALIHKYKFQQARAAARPIAKQMISRLPYFVDTLLVPVPTASKRVRQRGFDHTQLLVRQLSREMILKSQTALRRVGQTQQVGTKRSARIKQASGMFRSVANVTGKRILLVDDVVTTGATLQEAARVLKAAGAKQIDAAVFARAK